MSNKGDAGTEWYDIPWTSPFSIDCEKDYTDFLLILLRGLARFWEVYDKCRI
jgi:hypothetical protein